jgi:putative FmdB family regulatory protein
MPIYVYRCTLCDHEEERLEKYDEPSTPICPHHTTAVGMRRVPAIVNHEYRGLGWTSNTFR